MKEKDSSKKSMNNSKNLTRRRLIKGTAVGTLAATSLIKGFPNVHAASSDKTAIFAMGVEPQKWDPGIASTAGAAQIDFNVYDGLFRFEGWELRKNLVDKYKFSEDGSKLTLTIHKGVQFHDGAEMKASDAVFSMKRIMKLKGPRALLWKGITNQDLIRTVDDYTFTIGLEKSYGPILDTLAWVYVVNEKEVMAHNKDGDLGKAWLNKFEAGSGPFFMRSSAPGERWKFSRFPDYWRGWDSRHLNGFVIEVIREPATIRLVMKSGEAHAVNLWSIDVDAHEKLSKSGATQLITYAVPSIVNLKMNNQKWPTNNVNFRKACAYAFDYDAVIQGLLKGRSDSVFGPYPKGFKFWKSFENSNKLYRRDLDRARMHLRESGFNPSSETLHYNYRSFDPLQRDYGLVLQANLKEIGIKLELEGVTGPVYHERQVAPDRAAHFNRISGRGLMTDPDFYCMEQFHSRSWEGNKGFWATMSFYKNKRVNQLLDEGRFLLDDNVRKPMYEEVQDLIYEDCPDIMVDQQRFIVSLSNNLKGLVPNPLGGNPIGFYPMYFV